MLAVAGTALWLGGWVWTLFVAAVALGVLWEWWGLARGFPRRTAWHLVGLIYVLVAAGTLLRARLDFGSTAALVLVMVVVCIDVGAYFAGRTFGGPKIAPSISPSKTWSGLLGGAFGAAVCLWIALRIALNDGSISAVTFALNGHEKSPTLISGDFDWPTLMGCIAAGAVLAIVAQTGDFFESWMKRRAGVKDSGNLIPGHGGLFDRVDGLLAVCFVFGLAPTIPMPA